MNTLMSNELSTCGCCEGVAQLTPATIANRPGLSVLAYRVGIHATFLETMLARLSNMGIPLGELNTILDDPGKANKLYYPLDALTTRATDDPSIALLDAWAILADVLSFYQERIANEGYLRTATERRSLIELARLVDYTLRPGVAASVFLSYTLENGRVTTIPKGSRAQSIPGPGQLPQSFETSFDITARAAWNAIQPRLSVPQYITQIEPTRFPTNTFAPMSIDTDTADGAIYLDGIATQIKPNDVLLFAFGNEAGQQVFSHTLKIEPNAAQKYSSVTFPPPFTAPVYFRKILTIVDRYLDFSLFDVSPNNPIVLAVVPSLQELHKDIRTLLGLDSSSGTGGIGMQGPIHLSQRSSLLSSQHGRGNLIEDILTWNGNYLQAVSIQNDKVAAWLGALIIDMKTLLLTVDPGADLHGLVNPVVTTSIATLVAPLAKPPSLQPQNGTRLLRNAHGEFSRKSDIALQMLGTLNQAAQPTLLTAVSNASVTAGSPLQSIYAMRVKASPFGSNAPKQAVPVYDGNQISGTNYQEWQLVGTSTLYLQLADYSSGDTQITGTAILSENDNQIARTDSYTLIIPTASQEPLSGFTSPFKISVTTSNSSATPPPLDAVIIDSPNQRATLRFTNGAWNVTIDGDDDLHSVSIMNNGGAVIFSMTASTSPVTILDLDARYDHIVPNSWVVIEYGDSRTIRPKIIMVTGVQSLSRADYGMSGKITRLILAQPWLTGNETLLSEIRNITIYAQSEELKLAEEPLTDDIQGDTIELDNFYDGLKSGQWAVVSGERTDIVNTSGVVTSELVMIASVEQDVRQTNTPPPASVSIGRSSSSNTLPPPQSALPNDTTHTFLHFAQSLAYTYKRATVAVNANVVKATHGETRMEVLGSGDGSKALQQFPLKQSPLTYVSAPTPAGAASTLQVYVNDVQWHEVESLDAQGPKAHVFITKTDDTDKTTLTFGNGQQHGARPPTGVENIKALYRTGIGSQGNVDAGQISLLATRPLGVKGVMNPRSAIGGADRESISQARRNVPLATQALSRIVSVQDYADFARTFAGIGKANVLTLPTINRQLVHLTIAGLDNIPIDPTSDLYQNLFLALRTFGNPSEPLQVDACETKLLILSLRVRILPDYRLETVSPAIRAALLNAFSFEQRDLGQPVYESEIFSVVQQVPGVAFVDLDILDAVDQPKLLNALDVIHQQELQAAVNGVQPNETQDMVKLLNLQVRQVVPSFLARTVRNQPGVILPAQLVFLSPDVPDTLIINELTSTHSSLKSKKQR